MRRRSPSSWIWVAFLAVACATPAERAVPHLSFPPPPQRARFVYLGDIRSEHDLVRPGVWERLAALIGGRRAAEPLRMPFGLAYDPGGRLLVTDAERRAVLVLDARHGASHVIAPTGDAELGLPLGVDADAEGRIYVADGLKRVVRVFSRNGDPVSTLDAGGELSRPTGLAIDRARGFLYVADTPAHVVRVLALDGTPLRTVGGRGEEAGLLNFPTFLAVDAAGHLLVNDAMNFRVQVFDVDGRAVASIGKLGNGSGDMSRSKGVAFDRAGHVYVADALFDNFQVFDAKGRLLIFVGEHGKGPGQFWMPLGLAVFQREVAVADSAGRIQLFELVADDDTFGGTP